MKPYSLMITAAAALVMAGSAVASEIYKWTDDTGSVHYEDRPTYGTDIERLDVISRNTDNSVIQARLTAERKARATADQVASEAPPEMSKADVRAETEKRQGECEKYRDRLQAFLRSQRLYTENEAGEREYLDDTGVTAARAKVEEQITKYCGS